VTVRLVPLARGQLVYGALTVHAPPSSPVRVRSRSGAVDVRGLRPAIDVETTRGDVSVDARGGDVVVRTVSGAIHVVAAGLEGLELESVRGRVRFSGGLAPGARCVLESLTGPVELGEVRSAHARLVRARE
jgi:ferric-dicitrate binding protein FerR (iron transport regulator)